MHIQDPVRFFFGANTPQGFYGFHETDLYDPRDGWIAFLIKSGAGTGKATFMRRLWERAVEKGITGETVYCSSDPDSLDAIRFPAQKLCVVDATAPHILEPTAYGECEQLVPFGCCLPLTLTENTEDWFKEAEACAAGHARCCRLMGAAAGLLENNRRLQDSALRHDKIDATARRLAEKELGTKRNTRGQEMRRFLSAITPQGHRFFAETACALCPTIYVLEDEYGAAASALLTTLKEELLRRGHDLIACPCPLSPQTKLDHLLIPTEGVAFLTSNSHHRVTFPVYRRIHAARFMEDGTLPARKQQLRFNRRAAAELLREAAAHAAEAKRHHDRMEERHVTHMDWERWAAIADHTERVFLSLLETRSV